MANSELNELWRERDRLAALGYRIESDSVGYKVWKGEEYVGGAATLGTATHTSDGRRRSWQARRADSVRFFSAAVRTAQDHERRQS